MNGSHAATLWCKSVDTRDDVRKLLDVLGVVYREGVSGERQD